MQEVVATDRRVAPDEGITSTGALWFAFFAGPVAWTLDELVALTLHNDYCAARASSAIVGFSGIGAMLVAVGLVALGIAAAGGIVAAIATARLGRDTGEGITTLDRRRFMARFTLLLNVLFFYGILLRWATVFFVSPTACW